MQTETLFLLSNDTFDWNGARGGSDWTRLFDAIHYLETGEPGEGEERINFLRRATGYGLEGDGRGWECTLRSRLLDEVRWVLGELGHEVSDAFIQQATEPRHTTNASSDTEFSLDRSVSPRQVLRLTIDHSKIRHVRVNAEFDYYVSHSFIRDIQYMTRLEPTVDFVNDDDDAIEIELAGAKVCFTEGDEPRALVSDLLQVWVRENAPEKSLHIDDDGKAWLLDDSQAELLAKTGVAEWTRTTQEPAATAALELLKSAGCRLRVDPNTVISERASVASQAAQILEAAGVGFLLRRGAEDMLSLADSVLPRLIGVFPLLCPKDLEFAVIPLTEGRQWNSHFEIHTRRRSTNAVISLSDFALPDVSYVPGDEDAYENIRAAIAGLNHALAADACRYRLLAYTTRPDAGFDDAQCRILFAPREVAARLVSSGVAMAGPKEPPGRDPAPYSLVAFEQVPLKDLIEEKRVFTAGDGYEDTFEEYYVPLLTQLRSMHNDSFNEASFRVEVGDDEETVTLCFELGAETHEVEVCSFAPDDIGAVLEALNDDLDERGAQSRYLILNSEWYPYEALLVLIDEDERRRLGAHGHLFAKDLYACW